MHIKCQFVLLKVWQPTAEESQSQVRRLDWSYGVLAQEFISRTRCWWLMPVILATWEAKIGRIEVWGRAKANSSQDPISKITRVKWTGGITQAIECLFCKHEALSSNSSLTKNKNKSLSMEDDWQIVESLLWKRHLIGFWSTVLIFNLWTLSAIKNT
jgi:hypothetical protein